MASPSEYSSPFAYPSSGVPMMYGSGSSERSVNVLDHKTFCCFVPFDFQGKQGVYPESPWAFDSYHNTGESAMMYQFNFHYILALISQKSVGTPFVKLSHILGDIRSNDLNKIMRDGKNYEHQSATTGSPFFHSNVTQRISEIQNQTHRIAEPEPVDRPNNLAMATPVLNAYLESNPNIHALNANLGYFGDQARTKFDILFMPIYSKPKEANYEDRGIFGFIAIFICFDPAWDMLAAQNHFVAQYAKYQAGTRVPDHIDFDADSHILDYFTDDKIHDMYTSHFSDYIKINPNLAAQIRKAGITLNPDNSNTFHTFLSYKNAFLHATKYGDKENDIEWMAFYRNVEDQRSGYYTFNRFHDPYIFDYSCFYWNTNNRLIKSLDIGTNGKNGRGLYFEYMPWVTRYYRRESGKLIGFERGLQSLLDPPTPQGDAMDIDQPVPNLQPQPVYNLLSDEPSNSPPVAPVPKKKNTSPKSVQFNKNIYHSMHEKYQTANTNAEDTFIHSDHNVLVAIAERVRNPLQTLYGNIETFRHTHPELDALMFPQCKEGLHSLTLRQVERLNALLSELETTANVPLRETQLRILEFVKKRVITLSTVKPLTASILSVLQYIDGRISKSTLPDDSESTLDIRDGIPLAKRNISQYQIKMIDENLDITAHAAMYFVTNTRYYGYNIHCTHDIYKLKIGMLDAFRSEFNLHWNYGAFGPFGTSKSRALEVFKSKCVAGTYTCITSSSSQANTSSKDMSDRMRLLDESSSLLATNSKTPGAEYSENASTLKGEITQGYSVRQVLDPGKNFKERTTRNIVSVQIGCIAATANKLITDQALVSRFHTVRTEGETDYKKKGQAKPSDNKHGEELLAKMMQEQAKPTLHDMILHTPSDATKHTVKFFTESMQMEHCLTILTWKLIQVGVLRKPSQHIVSLVTVICKYLKSAFKISVGVRTTMRILFFCGNEAITTAVNTLYNVPSLYEHLHDKPFDINDLFEAKPYLHITLQEVLLAFSLMSSEFIKETDNLVMDALVNILSTSNFPLKRINDLFKHRNIERTRMDNPLHAAINVTHLGPDAMDAHSDPLWEAFKTNDTLPLEFLFLENEGKNNLSAFWRQMMPPNYQARLAAARRPAKVQPASIAANNDQGVVAPLNFAPAPSEANNEADPDNEIRIDLNFWKTGQTRTQLLDQLKQHFNKRLIPDQVESSFKDIETSKVTVLTSLPATKKEIFALQPGELLPRVQREMNCIEIDQDNHVCICVFLFSEIMNRPGNSSVIVQAIKSFLYQGLKPRTLLTGSELSDTYDLEFNTHVITAADVANASEYLAITDPSKIQVNLDSKHQQMTEQIKKNMQAMMVRGQLAAKKFNELSEVSLNTKEKRQAVALKTGFQLTDKVNEDNLRAEEETHGADFVEVASDSQELSTLAFGSQTVIPLDPQPEATLPYRGNGHQRIYMDIDEWSFIQNAFDNGIALRVDPTTRIPQFKMRGEWHDIHTPLKLMQLHKQGGLDSLTQKKISQGKEVTADSPPKETGFTGFYQTLNQQESAANSLRTTFLKAVAPLAPTKATKRRLETSKESKRAKKRQRLKELMMAPESSRTLPDEEEDAMDLDLVDDDAVYNRLLEEEEEEEEEGGMMIRQ